MKNEHILTPSVFALVALLHIGLMSLLWQSAKPAQVTVQHIEFVDLSDLGSGGGQPESAPAPPPPPPKVEPPKPRPLEPAKPVLKPVVTKNDKADIRQVPEKPKPVEQPKPKPKQETPEPKPADQVAERPAERPAAKITAAEGRGSGERSGGNHPGARGEGGGGGGQAGSGGGSGAGSSAANAIRANGTIDTPPYPPISRENGEEGRVVLKIMVSPDGRVTDVRVARSSGFARLDRAARNAGKNGRYQPSGWTEYTASVNFKLQ